jgi:4-amino-4-deoxy-L-arabinose transferase-like glycosyltransferase
MKPLYNRITSSLAEFGRVRHAYLAGAMLLLMFGLGLGSMMGNSAIVDEVAHIPAGYSYLHYGDYRLNPEHPPLMKDLAALPLQFMNLKFPDNEPAWTTDVNGQWESGWNFIYHIGNNADAILFWARLPILLIAIIFGGFLYWFVRKRWGIGVGLLALFFYTLSPNLLAHSTLVTTDLGASVFMFLAIVAFARFADKPTRGNVFLLSLALFGAQVAKFSAILLFPFLGLVTLMLVWLGKNPKSAWLRLKTYTGGFIGASALSVIWVWIFYTPHVWNMPLEAQDKLIRGSLYGDPSHLMINILTGFNHWPLMKPLVQYMLGLAMVFGRVAGGNVTYFNGQVSNGSFKLYFPEMFAVKTQVALLILMLVALVFVLWRRRSRRPFRGFERFRESVRNHVLEWSLGGFATFYFVVSVAGNLNLGVRHILPVYIPLFVLVAIATVRALRWAATTNWRPVAGIVFAGLLVWYGGSTVANHPNYLSYFNELIGGPDNAYKYFTDSGVDWGQDLKRLKTYVDKHPEINHVAVDYFGGGVPAYYFCQRKYDANGHLIDTAAGYDCSHSVMEEWHSQYGQYTGQYIAVSETFLENDKWYSELNNTPGYEYLRERTPVAKIGNSIYLYKLY